MRHYKGGDADLATLGVNLADSLNGVQMVDTRVKANLVHDDDPSLLRLFVELPDSRRNVAGGHDIGLALDGGLDDSGVVGIGNERDDEIVGSNFALEVRLSLPPPFMFAVSNTNQYR